MITPNEFAQIAFSFPNTESQPHLKQIAFKLIRGSLFATLNESAQVAQIGLPLDKQEEFHQLSPDCIYPLPNKWGKSGWTIFELKGVNEEVIRRALEVAYDAVSERKLKK
ncbi:MmcQ/YjbR family DNA-binding protein [Algoriphagus halophytocola]|uniref:MmcQ/YjbR family DNA-binding protein n=1 Tax=Algoriphagus halophytocola TaxID=2991499 RepID=A0ABY6MFJ3_9BACT|nr:MULTISPECIES: MmcQ/YjbR family DNA-binding protein [unclassified Algoriphagus]UZD22590.1 MmcQ/YjbR family DNA-binding protein [Algoriphagus sp. TR-M5]WBL43856.1 MmcQ/YjbR family DNA-binding protein [Algoriphagus sp. TR-M9]